MGRIHGNVHGDALAGKLFAHVAGKAHPAHTRLYEHRHHMHRNKGEKTPPVMRKGVQLLGSQHENADHGSLLARAEGTLPHGDLAARWLDNCTRGNTVSTCMHWAAAQRNAPMSSPNSVSLLPSTRAAVLEREKCTKAKVRDARTSTTRPKRSISFRRASCTETDENHSLPRGEHTYTLFFSGTLMLPSSLSTDTLPGLEKPVNIARNRCSPIFLFLEERRGEGTRRWRGR